MATLRFILGDQLSLDITSLKNCDKKNDVIFMCEVWQEATYVKHHKKKIAFIFSAMRHFAKELEKQGYNVDYVKLDTPKNTHDFTEELKKAISRHEITQVIATFPGEYRVYEQMQSWGKTFDIELQILPDERFLCQPDEFEEWASGKKMLRMEYFYRFMRTKYKILMCDDEPEGGQWNYDSSNRKPADAGLDIPKPYSKTPDKITKAVIELVAKRFKDHFGDLEPFYFAVTRKDALTALDKFIQERLVLFGDNQDAMLSDEAWMFHSHISFYLNCGLLNPLECIKTAEKAYKENQAPLNAVEGFIRQILGWREYVRGIYWLKMPEYSKSNYFNAKKALPEFFWDGDTKMHCLKQCISQTKKYAYAHHIQRLMVLGNFLLLAGIDPDAVNEWYLIVYADAFEWVEMPNVTGMILFADGGLLASKPYAASGAYINRMSDYCKNCHYEVKEKNGDKACPFNYLYWNFLIKQRPKLKNNQRLSMIYRNLDKMSKEKITAIKEDSEKFLDSVCFQ